MDDPFDMYPCFNEIKEALQNNDSATAATKIQEYLNDQENIPLNIGITGESGSGKSTFVNAFRGVRNDDTDAAPTGCVETTVEATLYPHPNYPNVTFWDLPGIGTISFPAAKYLEHVGFEKFDFFIIISADRFRENDVKLAQEIKRMGKKFYFVRSKIDHNVRDEKRSQREFNEEQMLDGIRNNCIKGLQKQGIEDPQVFLVSSFELHLFDFHRLQKALEEKLPAHKKNALLFAMPNVNWEIINRKKEAFHKNIKFRVLLSAVGAAVPLPGLSVSIDLCLLVADVRKYLVGFGLDVPSLRRLSESTRVPLSDLTDVLQSPLAAKTITKDVMVKVLSQLTTIGALTAAEEGSRFIPVFGVMIAMTLSSVTTYKTLSFFLDTLAEDAQRVFRRALDLNTPL